MTRKNANRATVIALTAPCRHIVLCELYTLNLIGIILKGPCCFLSCASTPIIPSIRYDAEETVNRKARNDEEDKPDRRDNHARPEIFGDGKMPGAV